MSGSTQIHLIARWGQPLTPAGCYAFVLSITMPSSGCAIALVLVDVLRDGFSSVQ